MSDAVGGCQTHLTRHGVAGQMAGRDVDQSGDADTGQLRGVRHGAFPRGPVVGSALRRTAPRIGHQHRAHRDA